MIVHSCFSSPSPFRRYLYRNNVFASFWEGQYIFPPYPSRSRATALLCKLWAEAIVLGALLRWSVRVSNYLLNSGSGGRLNDYFRNACSWRSWQTSTKRLIFINVWGVASSAVPHVVTDQPCVGQHRMRGLVHWRWNMRVIRWHHLIKALHLRMLSIDGVWHPTRGVRHNTRAAGGTA